MPGANTLARAAIAIVLWWFLIPSVFGGGWALANFGYLAVYAVKHPEAKRTLDSTDENARKSYTKSLIEDARKPCVVVLSVATFALAGALYGLIVRHWQSTGLIFLVTLLRGNPAFFAVPFSPFERAFIIVFCQLLVSYGVAYLFSRIGIKRAVRV